MASDARAPKLSEVALVLSLSVVVSLVGLELLLRLAHHDLFSMQNLILKQLENSPHEFEFDDRLAWVPVRSNQYMSPPYGMFLPFKVTTDASGFRVNTSAWRTMLTSRLRILALGDSFTFGNEVSDEETWPSHLQEVLKTEVINGGVPIYGLDQIALRAESSVALAHPNLVVVSITQQNIVRTGYSKQIHSVTNLAVEKPYFTLRGDGLRLMNSPVRAPLFKSELGWAREILSRSELANFLFRRFAVNWWLSMRPRNNAPAEYRTGASPVEVSCRLLRQLDTLARRARFVPVALSQAYWHELDEAYVPDAQLAQVYACAKALGWPSVETDPPLRAVFEKSSLEYQSLFLPWAHMTNRGNLLVARELASELNNVLQDSQCQALALKYGAQLPCESH